MNRSEVTAIIVDRYFAALDRGDIDVCSGCFAEDAILECRTNEMFLEGRKAIRAFFERITQNSRSMQHTVTRLVIDLDERSGAAELTYKNERIEGAPIDTTVCDLFQFNPDWQFERVCFWTGDLVTPAGPGT